MHEDSIVQALLERVEAEARARGAASVHRLHVRIGEASGVEVDLLRTAYDVFRERTLCENADITIVPVPVRWECPRCAGPIPPGAALRCPACSEPAKLSQGDEIILDRIEMEVASV
jgi:hydrogenase nickel incorporation protein HypA/HybF